MGTLSAVRAWPVPNVAAALLRGDGRVETWGDIDRVFRVASITKVLTAWAALIAVEDGSITLDQPVGQPGCTLRHLLCHAGGYAFDGDDPISAPERRRIYSNTGFELAGEAVAAAVDMPFAEYLSEAVLDPLGMTSSALNGSPAHGLRSTVADLCRFANEAMWPTLLHSTTHAEATHAQFPDLGGVVPGVGTFQPCPWGLGAEIHGSKAPHWMGDHNSPETFGHFGGAGTMMWIDPVAETALIALTDRPFNEWAAVAVESWRTLSDQALTAP